MTGCAELEKSLRECMDVPVCFLPSYLSACLFVCLARMRVLYFFMKVGREEEKKERRLMQKGRGVGVFGVVETE